MVTTSRWVVVLLVLLSACSTDRAPPHPTVNASSRPAPTVAATVAPDLGRLAERFVAHAAGGSASFPHRASVRLTLGGEPAASVDVASALADGGLWTACPEGWEGYAATSCPIDFLGPLRTAQMNGTPVVHEAAYDGVTCAPTRTGALPVGRLVVLRPVPANRDCARDFALVLVADERGRLRAIDLTLSAP
ncbi:hypothetical protein CFI00_13925 [Nocardioides sp. S5]|uniref:hypothetical protein n=1 Tax=Nocardioides sp. S5 TaxID=2017486 RepID=UPI001A8DFD75|nr:hypothetical protein [Nocardioides sp. S5]QSR31582.1 hypothetical protein CFI00_13925 [Nocardioides sp. S5]